MEVLWDNGISLLPLCHGNHELNMTNALLMFHSGFHGKQVSIAMRYEADAENVNYSQDFLNYMSTIDPYCIKSFDEASLKPTGRFET